MRSEFANGDCGSSAGTTPTALVLCGGGVRGAAEVGFYQALTELGIAYDFIVGTSIGAINGAFIAAGVPPEELRQIWLRVRVRRLLPPNWSVLWRGARAESLFSLAGLRRFLESHLPVQRFEKLRIPLVIVATDMDRGEEVVLGPDRGDLVEAVLASAALPGVFPPVRIDGRRLADGGIVSNLPIGVAVAHGARRVLSMECRCDDAYAEPSVGFVAQIFRAFHLARRPGRHDALMRYQGRAKLIILEPGQGCEKLPTSPSGLGALIDLAYQTAVHALSPHEQESGVLGHPSGESQGQRK